MKDKITEYIAEQRNEICIVIADKCFDDTKLPVIIKTNAEVNVFFEELIGLCKRHGFEVDSFGTKEQMINRFYRQNEKDDKLNKNA